MMKTRLIALLMASLTLLLFATSVSAKIPDDGIVAPCWEYMNSISVDISFLGTKGTASVSVDRIYQVTTRLEGTLTVYKQVGDDWVYVDSQSGTSTRALSIEFEFDAESGVKYKAVADVTAYGSSGSESDSATKEKTCP